MRSLSAGKNNIFVVSLLSQCLLFVFVVTVCLEKLSERRLDASNNAGLPSVCVFVSYRCFSRVYGWENIFFNRPVFVRILSSFVFVLQKPS